MDDHPLDTQIDSTDTSEAAAPPAPAGAAPDEIAELRRELEAKTDRYLRALADLENAKRRAQRDREEYVRFANDALLRDLLPTLDNLDRALDAARAAGHASSLLDGIELIQRDLLKALERHGLERYSALGLPFDPTRHEAVARVVSEDRPEHTVVGETMPGYLLNGRVVRPAMVAVAVRPDSDA